MQGEQITFSFGRNWKDFLSTVAEPEVREAVVDIEDWFGADGVAHKSVVDIGSGSGLHSLAFHLLGANRVESIDVDPHSVEATATLWKQTKQPASWSVHHASILDGETIREFGRFDIVYAWGSLHHTGQMWTAMDNAASMLTANGQMLVALYTKGPRYPLDLELKRRYNAASDFGQNWLTRKVIARRMWNRAKRFENPFGWNMPTRRGMNNYHDIIDWLGGLPYEVASAEEVAAFAERHHLKVERTMMRGEGACSIYLLRAES